MSLLLGVERLEPEAGHLVSFVFVFYEKTESVPQRVSAEQMGGNNLIGKMWKEEYVLTFFNFCASRRETASGSVLGLNPDNITNNSLTVQVSCTMFPPNMLTIMWV